MQVTILGPNLRGTPHTFHVHRSGCADIRRNYLGSGKFGGDGGWSIEATTQLEVVEETYADILAEQDPDDGIDWLRAYAQEFHFAPCCSALRED